MPGSDLQTNQERESYQALLRALYALIKQPIDEYLKKLSENIPSIHQKTNEEVTQELNSLFVTFQVAMTTESNSGAFNTESALQNLKDALIELNTALLMINAKIKIENLTIAARWLSLLKLALFSAARTHNTQCLGALLKAKMDDTHPLFALRVAIKNLYIAVVPPATPISNTAQTLPQHGVTDLQNRSAITPDTQTKTSMDTASPATNPIDRLIKKASDDIQSYIEQRGTHTQDYKPRFFRSCFSQSKQQKLDAAGDVIKYLFTLNSVTALKPNIQDMFPQHWWTLRHGNLKKAIKTAAEVHTLVYARLQLQARIQKTQEKLTSLINALAKPKPTNCWGCGRRENTAQAAQKLQVWMQEVQEIARNEKNCSYTTAQLLLHAISHNRLVDNGALQPRTYTSATAKDGNSNNNSDSTHLSEMQRFWSPLHACYKEFIKIYDALIRLQKHQASLIRMVDTPKTMSYCLE